jgi:hypothetical protein
MLVRKGDMAKLTGSALVALVLLVAASPGRERFARYKAIEAYEIRPGILMMPRYSPDGQVCEIGVEKLHYTPERVRLSSSLSRKEVDQIFDELVPSAERGPKPEGPSDRGSMVFAGSNGMVVTEEYRDVSISFYGLTSPGAGKDEITLDEVAATIKWKSRSCQ